MAFNPDPFRREGGTIGLNNPFSDREAREDEQEYNTFNNGISTFGELASSKYQADAAIEMAKQRAKQASQKSGGGGFGGILGSVAGSFLGPIGTAAGGAIGKLFG